MEIKSLSFLLFCLIITFFYFALQATRNQKYVLLFADIIFVLNYSGKRGLVIVLCVSSVVFLSARMLELKEEIAIRKLGLIIGLLSSLGVLIFFKYFQDTYRIIKDILDTHHVYLPQLVVPVGISYFTLSLSGYLIDVYHKKYNAEKNFLDFLSFVLFFPAIVEGPINLYKKMMPQIKTTHVYNWDRMISGLQRMLWGYIKKIVIADRIGIFVMGILQSEESYGFLVLSALIAYSFQIYADFSGGIDVIMGVAEIWGFELNENFKSPLVSKSITEYWQRWHRSLGDWMEKYIYYPIVLNRRVLKFSKKIHNKYMSKAFSATLASVIVFIVVGIWHGTGWNYVVYGLYQALFVSMAVALAPFYKKIKRILHVNEKCISWNIFCILRTFIILMFGRILIKAGNLSQAKTLLVKLGNLKNIYVLFDGSLFNYGLDYKNFYLMILGIVGLILIDVLHEKGIHFRKLLMKQDIVFRYIVYLTGLFLIIIFGIYGPEFSAASFIYQGF